MSSSKNGFYVFVYFGNDFFPCLSAIESSQYSELNKIELAIEAELSLSGEAVKQFFKDNELTKEMVNGKKVFLDENLIKKIKEIKENNIYQFQ